MDKRLENRCRRKDDHELLGKSVQITSLRERIALVGANVAARTLIVGEAGTGRLNVATLIHNRSPRKAKPFYSFSCGSVNPELLADVFLGHEKDAFPGAVKAERGLLELANGGTLFLDDVGRIPFEIQDLLLNFIENGSITRLGGSKEIDLDVRIITATPGDLAELVHVGKFSAELFMRLNVVQLRIPPLRERRDDIRYIADAWWVAKCRKHLTEDQIAALHDYDFPGNVRELMNLLERAVVLKMPDFGKLMVEHRQLNSALEDPSVKKDVVPDELEKVIKLHIRQVYSKYGENSSKAADALKITRNTLRKYLHD